MANYEMIELLIEKGAVFPKGEGHEEDRQWLVIHTTWGDVVYKEFWTGPG